MVVIAVLLLGRLTPLWRSTIVALGVLLAAIAAATLVSIGDEAWEAILGAFGKDSGLTGRAYLWYRAEEAIARDRCSALATRPIGCATTRMPRASGATVM
jgi:O-antigen ligase